MNKVININLGGYPFTIDDVAFQHLDKYLITIRRHFQDSEGFEEIIGDIETRMAELFEENLGSRKIVTLQDVENAITIMGTPEDFGTETIEEPLEEQSSSFTKSKKKYKTGKRLFRNPDDAVIGGVCSGIAAYFGISDPLWVRIAFIIATTTGFSVIAYIILWAITTDAETAGDRLAMRGEPINVSNIGRIIEEEVDNISQKVTELGGEIEQKFGSKKKSFGKTNDVGTTIRSTVEEGISLLGKFIKTAIRVFSRIFKPLLIILTGIVLLALTAAWIASIVGIVSSYSFFQFLLPDIPFITALGITNFLIVLGVPLASIALLVFRLFFQTRISRNWKAGMWSIWIVNLISLFAISMSVLSKFDNKRMIEKEMSQFNYAGDTLQLTLEQNPYDQYPYLEFGNKLKTAEGNLINENIEIIVEKSNSTNFEYLIQTQARGKNSTIATELAEQIQFEPAHRIETLYIPSHFVQSRGTKWRSQVARLIIKVPVGKHIRLKDMDHSYIHYYSDIDRNFDYPRMKGGQTWKMTENGLICPAHLKANNHSSSFDYIDFSKVNLTGAYKLNIIQGPEYKINLLGKAKDIEKIDVNKVGDLLDISNNDQKFKSTVEVTIQLPNLALIDMEELEEAKISGFINKQMEIRSEGKTQIKAFIEIENLIVDLDRSSKLDLRGSGKNLSLNLNKYTEVDAEHYPVKTADYYSTGNGNNMKLSVSDTLRRNSEGSYELELFGTPVEINE